jgi:hypothetical protein
MRETALACYCDGAVKREQLVDSRVNQERLEFARAHCFGVE